MVLAWGSHSLSFSSAPTEKGVNNDIFMATRATTTGRKKRPEQESLRSTSRNPDAKVASSRALKKELIRLASWRCRCVCSPSIRSKTTAVFVGGTVENMSYRPLSVSIFFLKKSFSSSSPLSQHRGGGDSFCSCAHDRIILSSYTQTLARWHPRGEPFSKKKAKLAMSEVWWCGSGILKINPQHACRQRLRTCNPRAANCDLCV